MKIRVLVVFGGQSVEHEISIITAVQAMHSFNEEMYEIIPLYLAKNGFYYSDECLKDMKTYRSMDVVEQLTPVHLEFRTQGAFVVENKRFSFKTAKEFDLAFPLMHGTNGEDGSIQGLFQLHQFPCCMSPCMSAALLQDKGMMKEFLLHHGLNTLPYVCLKQQDDVSVLFDKIHHIGYPCILKPVHLGSSVGIEVIMSETEALEKVYRVFQYDERAILEPYIQQAEEFNLAVLGDANDVKLSDIEQIEKQQGFFSYEEKYGNHAKKGMAYAKRKLPALISEQLTKQIQELGKSCFQIFHCRGVIRIDFIYDIQKEEVYINEINTIPGSLAYYLWEGKGLSYTQLLDQIIWIERNHYRKQQKQIVSYESNLLKHWDNHGLKSGSKLNLDF